MHAVRMLGQGAEHGSQQRLIAFFAVFIAMLFAVLVAVGLVYGRQTASVRSRRLFVNSAGVVDVSDDVTQCMRWLAALGGFEKTQRGTEAAVGRGQVDQLASLDKIRVAVVAHLGVPDVGDAGVAPAHDVISRCLGSLDVVIVLAAPGGALGVVGNTAKVSGMRSDHAKSVNSPVPTVLALRRQSLAQEALRATNPSRLEERKAHGVVKATPGNGIDLSSPEKLGGELHVHVDDNDECIVPNAALRALQGACAGKPLWPDHTVALVGCAPGQETLHGDVNVLATGRPNNNNAQVRLPRYAVQKVGQRIDSARERDHNVDRRTRAPLVVKLEDFFVKTGRQSASRGDGILADMVAPRPARHGACHRVRLDIHDALKEGLDGALGLDEDRLGAVEVKCILLRDDKKRLVARCLPGQWPAPNTAKPIELKRGGVKDVKLERIVAAVMHAKAVDLADATRTLEVVPVQRPKARWRSARNRVDGHEFSRVAH
eukprot:m.3195 g.3195  ORF g.3195 m.3195 type:complete len:487 (-) comp2272_c0_seq2:613-2073(-)